MLLKNLQLFESLLSPKKQRLHWYRGINLQHLQFRKTIRDEVDKEWDGIEYTQRAEIQEEKERELINNLDIKDIGVNYNTEYGDKTPAQWFATNMMIQKYFGNDIMLEVKINPDVDLFNYFNKEDNKRFHTYCMNNDIYVSLNNIGVSDLKQHHKRSFKNSAWEVLEEQQNNIKKQGFDGIILREGNDFTIELFYNKFTIINRYTQKQTKDLIKKIKYGKNNEPNYNRQSIIVSKQRKLPANQHRWINGEFK